MHLRLWQPDTMQQRAEIVDSQGFQPRLPRKAISWCVARTCLNTSV